jgi:hypothetical protein
MTRDSREPRENQAQGSLLLERRRTKAAKRPRTKKQPLRDTTHEQRTWESMKNASVPAEDHARKSTQARGQKMEDRSEMTGCADRKSVKQERDTKSSKMDNKKRTKSKTRAPQNCEQKQLEQESCSRNSKAWKFRFKKNKRSTEPKTRSVISSTKEHPWNDFVVDKEAKSTRLKSSPTTQEQHEAIWAMLSDLSDLSSPFTDKYAMVDSLVEERDEKLLTRALSQSDARQDLPCEETVAVLPKNGTGASSGSEVVTSRESTENLKSIRWSTLSESAREPQMTPSFLGEDTLGNSFATEDPDFRCLSNFDSGINLFF